MASRLKILDLLILTVNIDNVLYLILVIYKNSKRSAICVSDHVVH